MTISRELDVLCFIDITVDVPKSLVHTTVHDWCVIDGHTDIT